ncbi:outer membrane beta-barrel protein [Asticcacaulis sp. W401b]|uniref:outer membrane beta-barrel protein n=1 Tax=Asticcacaulis sp. W401b TaxID=3388666 RepID=UPI003970F466
MANLVKALMASAVLCMTFSSVASAQDTEGGEGVGFKRDRNQSVKQRVPAEYRPLGIRWGGFTASPKVTADLETTDNVYYASTGKKDDIIFRLKPELGVRSNWSRHMLSGLARAGTNKYSDFSDESYNEVFLTGSGRYDIVGSSNLFGGVAYTSSVEPRGEETSILSAAKPIEFKASSGNAGFVAGGNRLRLIGRVDYQKFDYKDVRRLGGGVIDMDDRDRVETRGSLRGEYAVSPDTSVYVVYEGNKREYDIVGTSGVRDSDGYEVAVGVNLDLSKLVRGEAQIGYLSQSYDNTKFAKASGASYKARLEWFPTQLTTVGFNASRGIKETPAVGSSGYESAVLGVSVDHEVLRNFIVSGAYTKTDNSFNGIDRSDKRTAANVAATYRVNRTVAVTGGYYYSDLSSSGKAKAPEYDNKALKLSVTFAY